MKRMLYVLLTLSMALSVALVATGCDSNGASSGPDEEPITAAAALAALPTAAEALGLQSAGVEASVFSARSDVAGADWMTLERCPGDDEGDDGGDVDPLCEAITNGVNEFLSGDSFVGILKSIAALEDLTLEMNTANRLASVPGSVIPEPDWPDEVDLGVLRITELEETILLQWTIDFSAIFGEGPMYYIQAELTGWPEITRVDFWMINEEDSEETPYRWEYQSLNLTDRSATKYVTQPNDSGGTRERHERNAFRGDGSGGLDGVFSLDEPGDSTEGGNRYMSSFSIRNTSAGVAYMGFASDQEELISNTEEPFSNTTISIYNTTLALAFTETSAGDGTIDQTVFGRELSLSRDPAGEPVAADTVTRNRLLGADLQTLFSTWSALQLPSGADRPNVPADFPALPEV